MSVASAPLARTPAEPAGAVAPPPMPSWEEDLARRMNPELVTALLAEAAKAGTASGMRFVEVAEGSCRAVLPLTRANTNQYGAHQGMVMALAADYVSGTALASLYRGVPVLGVHPVPGADAAAMWHVSVDIRYREPSTEDLLVEAAVPVEQGPELRRRFWAGKPSFVPVEVVMRSRSGRTVATATMTVFVRHVDHIRPSGAGEKAGVMFRHMLKTSARLIANIRGRAAGRPDALYADPWSRRAAGRHGELLGERFLELLPPLETMIEARTRHGDDRLRAAVASGVRQVALVGAGLDFRPFRLAEDLPEVRWFEMDLPAMLEERERVLASLGLRGGRRQAVPLNLDFDDVAEVLARAPGFRADEPVFVIFEGVSMYLAPDRAPAVFAGLARAVGRHPDSRLWLDLVRRAAFAPDAPPAARAFLDGMAQLGEPFLFGCDRPEELFAAGGLAVAEEAPSGRYRPVDPGAAPLLDLYRFVELAPATH